MLNTTILNSSNASRLDYYFNFLKAFVNWFVHLLLGCLLIVSLWYVFKENWNSLYKLHILLSVLGYQLLMAQGILSLHTANSWSLPLSFLHRRRFHWVIQVLGSGLAIAGSSIMIYSRKVHFRTLHGKTAIIAMAFTIASLINGLTSLYAPELKRYIPPLLSKVTHIILGTAAFALSSASLCYATRYRSFKTWTSDEISFTFMAALLVYTFIIIIPPCWRLWKLLRSAAVRTGAD